MKELMVLTVTATVMTGVYALGAWWLGDLALNVPWMQGLEQAGNIIKDAWYLITPMTR